MIIEFVGRSYEIDGRVRAHTEEKLGKVLKFLDDPIEVHVTLEREGHQCSAEIHLSHRHGSVHTHESSEQMLESINLAIDKAEKQARRAKKKFQDKRRRARNGDHAQHWPVDVVDRGSLGTGTGPRIIKSGRIQIKPMSIEEAALQLDDSRNEFVVFLDAESGLVSVLYRRKDSNYGLIAPEF